MYLGQQQDHADSPATSSTPTDQPQRKPIRRWCLAGSVERPGVVDRFYVYQCYIRLFVWPRHLLCLTAVQMYICIISCHALYLAIHCFIVCINSEWKGNRALCHLLSVLINVTRYIQTICRTDSHISVIYVGRTCSNSSLKRCRPMLCHSMRGESYCVQLHMTVEVSRTCTSLGS